MSPQVEARVCDPRRPAETRDPGRGEPGAEARQHRETLLQQSDQLVERRWPACIDLAREDEGGSNVHGRALIGLLELQKRSVQRRQLLVGCFHGPTLGFRRRERERGTPLRDSQELRVLISSPYGRAGVGSTLGSACG